MRISDPHTCMKLCRLSIRISIRKDETIPLENYIMPSYAQGKSNPLLNSFKPYAKKDWKTIILFDGP